ncbi:MAG TPA: hypothetical protein VGE14_09330 [Marmoricola sp.]
MRTTIRLPGALAAALVILLALAGCGDSGGADAPDASDGSGSTAGTSGADAADGDWLLRFATAEGADGERSRAVYVRYNPTTGAATRRVLPAVSATDAGPDEQVLLVSADHALAIPDTGIPEAEQRAGELIVYSLTDESTRSIDIRTLTGKPDLRPTAWAFDPTEAGTLRVVDAALGVWLVDLSAGSATLEDTLPRREGWIFANGFDHDTGRPYIESIDSDETEPAGNGAGDLRPVERQGGTVLRYDGEDLPGLPTPPCGFAGGFAFDDVAWLFCADTPSIAAYQAHDGGTSWHAFGTPSAKLVPATAAEMAFALPPVDAPAG